MTVMVQLALLGWIPFVMAMFAMMPARKAVVWAYLLGWLFLPQAGWVFESLPDYTKVNAPTVGVLLGVLIFDSGRLLTFKPRWVDIPVLIYTVMPFISCVSNNIGGSTGQALYGGMTLFLDQVQVYSIPWVLARVYVTKFEHLRDVAVAFVYAGLIYMPLCLFEVRLSPQLNNWIYGFYQAPFLQAKRLGGFRPLVFMQHGLMVGLFLTNVVIVAWWLMRARVMREAWGIPMGWCVGILTVTAVLAKSTGAFGLLVFGGAMIYLTSVFRTRVFLAVLLSLVPMYMYVRAADIWHGEGIYDLVAQVDQVRAESLTGRMGNEDLFLEKARERIWLGWAGWNRWQVFDPESQDLLTTPDGLWVIALGQFGVIGLSCIFLMMILPMILLLLKYRPRDWMTPTIAPAAALATALVIFALDCLLNAMVASFYFHAAGAAAGVLATTRPAAVRRAAPNAAPRAIDEPASRGALPGSAV